MTCLIRQPAGLGDIIWIQKILHEFSKKYDEVIFPVIPQYLFIKDYLKLPSNVNVISKDDYFLGKDLFINNNIIDVVKKSHMDYYPLEMGSKKYPKELIMKAKYKIAGVDCSDWKDYFHVNRNTHKENELRKLFPEKYNLICDTFASPPDERKINISVNSNVPNCKLEYKSGYNPFDWMKVIEDANEIHFVDTCYSLIMEKLKNSMRLDEFLQGVKIKICNTLVHLNM